LPAARSTRRSSRTGGAFSANNSAHRLKLAHSEEETPVQVLLILNDPPYGAERTYNGLRLALALAKSDPAITVTVFLMADAVVAAKSGQKTPDGYYNVERMLKGVLAGKGQVLLCGTCMDARGLTDAEILSGVRRSSMAELATLTASAAKVMVF
jgi:uncharacterized protein involved in oxidation of intracellular sulfur